MPQYCEPDRLAGGRRAQSLLLQISFFLIQPFKYPAQSLRPCNNPSAPPARRYGSLLMWMRKVTRLPGRSFIPEEVALADPLMSFGALFVQPKLRRKGPRGLVMRRLNQPMESATTQMGGHMALLTIFAVTWRGHQDFGNIRLESRK